MKILNTIFKIILALLLVSPILGVLGIFPAPTRDLYNTDQAFTFIQTVMDAGYIMWIMAAVFLVSIILIIRNKMAAVALLLIPITINIFCFHLFLDGGIFTAGASMAVVLFLLNLYFLWQNRAQYKDLV